MMKLKNIFKYALMGAASCMILPSLVACDDDDDNRDADPVIRYVRSTDAAASDSLITAASLGNVIAIVGENLESVRAISFNDKPALLNTCYITDKTIIVTVPKDIPEDITDKMYVTAWNGNVIEVPFVASIPAPVVTSISNEYAEEGEIVYVNGNFFVGTESDPVTLTFPGNKKAVYIPEKSSYTSAAFEVPAGVEAGTVSLSTPYGVTNPSSSTIYMKDDRHMLMTFDDFTFGGWGKTAIVDGDFGKCAHLFGEDVDLWSWIESTSLLFSLTGEGQPAFESPVSKPDQGVLKFELKVDKPWSAVALYMEFQTPDQQTNNSFGTNPGYCWEPWKAGTYQTDGWVTVSIPLSNFSQTTDAKAHDGGTFDPSLINGLNLFVRGGTGAEGITTPVDMYIDNIRIVPFE